MEMWFSAVERIGFPAVLALFGAYCLLKSGKFLGLRLFGDNGYVTVWLKTTTSCQKQQAEAMVSMAGSMSGIKALIETEISSRLALDRKVTDLLLRFDDEPDDTTDTSNTVFTP